MGRALHPILGREGHHTPPLLRTLKAPDLCLISVAITGDLDPDQVLPRRHGEGSGKFSVAVSQPEGGPHLLLYLRRLQAGAGILGPAGAALRWQPLTSLPLENACRRR